MHCTNDSIKRAYGHLVKNCPTWCTFQLVNLKQNIPTFYAAAEETLCCSSWDWERSFCHSLVEQWCLASLLVNSDDLKALLPVMELHFFIPEKWMIMCFRDPLPQILYILHHISYSALRDWKPPFFDSTAFYFSPRTIPVMLLKLLLHFGICCVMEILKWSSTLSIWTWWMSQSEVLLLGAPLLMFTCGSQGCSLTPHSEFIVNLCTTLKRLWRPYRKKNVSRASQTSLSSHSSLSHFLQL